MPGDDIMDICKKAVLTTHVHRTHLSFYTILPIKSTQATDVPLEDNRNVNDTNTAQQLTADDIKEMKAKVTTR